MSLHQLKFRYSELNSTNSRYDSIEAGASDDERFVQWVVFATISLGVASFITLVLLSILCSRNPQLKRRAFNLYLVFLTVPDLVLSLFCGINCVLNAVHGDYISAAWCRFQGVYLVWGIGVNAWLNAVIARHVHDMLVCGHQMKRYFAPTRRVVILESLAVYLWVGFLAAWPFVEFLPHRLRLSGGVACLPQEYDTTSTVFFWLVFLPCFVLVPTGYVLYAAVDVWRRQLLPLEGKRRNIAVYFFRLTVVFLVMWVPSLFLIFIGGGYTSTWVTFAGGAWSHLQGAVSAVASIMKEDIGQAFKEFLTCKCWGPPIEEGSSTMISHLNGIRSVRLLSSFSRNASSAIQEPKPASRLFSVANSASVLDIVGEMASESEEDGNNNQLEDGMQDAGAMSVSCDDGDGGVNAKDCLPVSGS